MMTKEEAIKVLANLGISIYDECGNTKCGCKIRKDIEGVWHKLNKKQRYSIYDAIFYKYHNCMNGQIYDLFDKKEVINFGYSSYNS